MPFLVALIGGSAITLFGASTMIYPLFVIAMLPFTLLSFWFWGGPEGTGPRVNDPFLVVVGYAANVLLWSALLWVLTRKLWHRTGKGGQKATAA
jgi:hypothetical protein